MRWLPRHARFWAHGSLAAKREFQFGCTSSAADFVLSLGGRQPGAGLKTALALGLLLGAASPASLDGADPITGATCCLKAAGGSPFSHLRKASFVM
mmetsp:Transcript_8254/g.23648  ORF Transcript_8254/g.23648 Transcript_8254/m.23648 type:complete len:96 (+) Transcript_8254:395-682(+)